jgi:hypothetical protein
MANFFNLDKKYVVNELNNSRKLRKNFKFGSKLNYNQLCEVFSRFSAEQIMEYVLKGLNFYFKRNSRTSNIVLIDSTAIPFNINTEKNYYSDEKLDKRNFKIGFSSDKKSFIGGKLTIALDYYTCKPLAMIFTPGAKSDTKLYLDILEELKNRRILKKESLIIADKGFHSYDNYEFALRKYHVVPLIYPKKNTKLSKILSRFSLPLEAFSTKKYLVDLFKRLIKKFKNVIVKWRSFRKIRSKIEDFNKFFKNGVGYIKVPAYTYKSVAKNTFLTVFLAGTIVSMLEPDSKMLQHLTEM